MNQIHNRRSFIRWICFGTALVLVLSLLAYQNWSRAEKTERQIEHQYMKSIDDLGNYMENIESTLTKTMYAGTSATMSNLTSKLWRESGFAKECVSNLPISQLNLENTYKFLSQIGDYTLSLGKKMASGESITEEERKNMSQMRTYAHRFLEEILVAQDAIRTGSISFTEVKQEVGDLSKDSTSTTFSDGFLEFEEGFTDYPTLIYDGPFSDHILEKKPDMTENMQEINQKRAKEIAANACSVEVSELQDDENEEGNMPSYTFKGENINVGVTKKGGMVTYFIKDRQVESEEKPIEECQKSARNYLDVLGIENMQETYYEISNNIITINYASKQNDVLCYTDLVKVSVAMDNGEVLRYDGRGYITNHKNRPDLKASISQSEAKESLSPLLSIKSVQLALIPSEGQNEVLCYEFLCSSSQDENVLVYIDAKTGAEQQILVLYIDEKGTLTI